MDLNKLDHVLKDLESSPPKKEDFARAIKLAVNDITGVEIEDEKVEDLISLMHHNARYGAVFMGALNAAKEFGAIMANRVIRERGEEPTQESMTQEAFVFLKTGLAQSLLIHGFSLVVLEEVNK